MADAWLDSDRTILLQCVFAGHAQEALSSLSTAVSAVYAKVKVASLKVYKLVPEACRQRFRYWEKGDGS